MVHANNMSDMYQSAYRKHHYTESALICVTNDIKLAMDYIRILVLKKDMLCELHWLPVRKRVHYKLLLFSYKTLNGSAPDTLWTSDSIITLQGCYDLVTGTFWVWKRLVQRLR